MKHESQAVRPMEYLLKKLKTEGSYKVDLHKMEGSWVDASKNFY